MEHLIPQVWNVVVYLVVWVLLAIVRKPLNDALIGIQSPVVRLFDSFSNGTQSARTLTEQVSNTSEEITESAIKAAEAIFQKIINNLGNAGRILKIHCAWVLDFIGNDKNLVWRVIGTLVYFVFSILFIYADLVQGANNLTGLFPNEEVPWYLQNLFAPLLVASAGSAFMFGLILGDFVEISNFAPWNELKGKVKPIAFVLVLLNTIVSIALSLLIAAVRFSSLAQSLPSSLATDLHNLASFAQFVIILPMLIATLLISWWGLMALGVFWVAIIASLVLLMLIFRFFTELLKIALAMGGNGTSIAFKVLFGLFDMIFRTFGALFELTGKVTDILFNLVEHVLNIVTYPLVLLGEKLTRKP